MIIITGEFDKEPKKGQNTEEGHGQGRHTTKLG